MSAHESVTTYYRRDTVMVDYREILRLHSQNNSNRQIASIVGSGRTKVGEVIETAKSKGIE
jgi:hypothetical protein